MLNHANKPSPLIARARRGVQPLLAAGAGQAPALNVPCRAVRKAQGSAGPEKPRRDNPQVEKAGFQQQKDSRGFKRTYKSEERSRNSERKSC